MEMLDKSIKSNVNEEINPKRKYTVNTSQFSGSLGKKTGLLNLDTLKFTPIEQLKG